MSQVGHPAEFWRCDLDACQVGWYLGSPYPECALALGPRTVSHHCPRFSPEGPILFILHAADGTGQTELRLPDEEWL